MKKLLGMTMVVAVLAVGAQAGLITNGNFDTDTVPDGTQVNTASSWGLTPAAPICNPLSTSALQPYSGDNLMYVGNVQGQYAAAYQTITMDVGKQYKITFRARNYPNDSYVNYAVTVHDSTGATNYFGVSDFITSGGIWTYGASGNTSTWTLVESAAYTATATDVAGGCRLGISTYNNTTNPGYVCIDNIDVVEVPEPTTMCLLGAGGLLAMVRRRRK